MSEREAVTFDLDDTLVRYERSPGKVLQLSFDRLDLEPLFTVEEYYERYAEFADRYDSMAQLRSECFAALAAANGFERDLGREVAAVYEDERDQSNVELLPAAGKVLETVSERYDVGIVTNGARDTQQAKIDAVDIEQWVDTVVIAGHQVPPKPSPEPFDHALQALSASPDATVHVGDSLESDVAGARAACLDSVWISASDSGRGEWTYRVDSVGGLLSTQSKSDREEFVTTSRLLAAMATAANSGLISPTTARGIAIPL